MILYYSFVRYLLISMDNLKIGWIGTGVMGLSMCKHLLKRKFQLSVFNRTQEKANPLL
jgi:3-hydroxyisobutyrate dehydrogenase